MSGTYVGPVPVAGGGGLPSDWSVVEPDGIDVGANGYANWTSPLGGNAIMETDNSEFAEWTLFPIAGGWSGDPNANIDSYIDATYASMFASLTALLRAYITVQTSGGGRTNLNLEAKNGGGTAKVQLDAVDARATTDIEDDLVMWNMEFPTEVDARIKAYAQRAGLTLMELIPLAGAAAAYRVWGTVANPPHVFVTATDDTAVIELGASTTQPGGMTGTSGLLYTEVNGGGKLELRCMLGDFTPIILATQA